MSKTAFVFPDPAGEHVGMGRDLYDGFPESRALFDQAESFLGFVFKKLCFEGPETLFRQPHVTEAAGVTCALAALAAFKSGAKKSCDFIAGYDLGMFSALVAAESISFEQCLRLLIRRRRIIEDAGRASGWRGVAGGCEESLLKEMCLKTGCQIVGRFPAGRFVLTGNQDGMEALAALCREQGAQIAVQEGRPPFHSEQMFKAAVEFKTLLDGIEISPARFPLVSSSKEAVIISRPYQLREEMMLQMNSPLCWERTMSLLQRQGVIRLCLFGAGNRWREMTGELIPGTKQCSFTTKEDIDSAQGGD